jgi:hypothetical protein
MSEPDAVPLPREGEVFFDVRGESRSMRLSWYANSAVAVFSIWQGNRCTGTFRLPFADLTRMVQALEAGPPVGVPAAPPSAGGYREPDYGQDHDLPATSSYSQPMPADASFASTTAYYPGQDYSGPGYAEPEYAEPEYQQHEYQQPEYQQPEYQQPEYRESEYQQQPPDYREPEYQEPDYGGWGEQGYADGDSGSDQPYGDHPYGHRGHQEDYSADPGYGRAGRHSASYPMPDYDPPAQGQPSGPVGQRDYGDDNAAGPHSSRTQPDLVGSQHAWSESGWSEGPAQPDPLRSRDAESVPDPAVMSFPSVPARNGPSDYR